MKINIFLLLSFIHLSCEANETILSHLNKYTRPITILYASENPRWLNIGEQDTIIYWTQNKQFQEQVLTEQPKNCILLTTPISKRKVRTFAASEKCDVAIFDTKIKNLSSAATEVAKHLFIAEKDARNQSENFIYMPGSSILKKYNGKKIRNYFFFRRYKYWGKY